MVSKRGWPSWVTRPNPWVAAASGIGGAALGLIVGLVLAALGRADAEAVKSLSIACGFLGLVGAVSYYRAAPDDPDDDFISRNT